MTSPLDDPAAIARLDPTSLLVRIAGLPEQIEQAWSAASALDLPPSFAGADRVCVLGMGGSGIGGALLRALAVETGARAPVEVVRGYRLPAYVDERSLVFASSASGNTEETLAAFEQAMAAGARCIAVTTGGRLAAIARERGACLLSYDWAGEPRAALGWSFITLVAICSRLRLLTTRDGDVRAAVSELRQLRDDIGADVPEAKNAAKRLARRLAGRLPVVVGAEGLGPVAYRWRTQLNENAKTWAIADELPEMNHNAPLGYGAPPALLPLLHAVLLRQPSLHPRIARRIELTQAQLAAAGVACEVVDCGGDSPLAEMLRAVSLGDFVSYYAGILHGVDPSSMQALEDLKRAMAAAE
jgi:glucose/mannose-6-phosphate isomerase